MTSKTWNQFFLVIYMRNTRSIPPEENNREGE
jgi:hypothetical protein